MLDRRVVLPYAPRKLRLRQYEQWHRAIGLGYKRGSMKRSDGYKWPCWICGELGILGVDGFSAKGLIRPRNIMHEECYETLTTEQRRLYRHRDVMLEMRRRQRSRAKRNLDRVSIKRRQARNNG